MKMLNLGCGNRYHKDWINFDFKSNSENVIEFNLYNELPFDSESIDVIYSSHVLEHFPKCEAPNFLKRCYRVLKKNGIIRLVVPDLETIIKNYLYFLEKAKKGDKDAKEKYNWTLIELFDQMVRNYSGGEMLKWWMKNPIPQEEFIIQRVGSEVKNAIQHIKTNPPKLQDCIQKDPLKIGQFRLSGEVHQWMYDEFSLSELLKECGFKNIKKVQANESSIPNFNKYLLDIEKDGSIRKPDSLFIEAIK
jgi:predicted SAM-dependent methyltransferase